MLKEVSKLFCDKKAAVRPYSQKQNAPSHAVNACLDLSPFLRISGLCSSGYMTLSTAYTF